MTPSNFAAPIPLRYRFWARLGFGQNYPAPSVMEDDPRFAPGALMTVVKTQLSWGDRIRTLISGRIVIRSRTLTDAPVKVSITHSTFSVCHPGEPL